MVWIERRVLANDHYHYHYHYHYLRYHCYLVYQTLVMTARPRMQPFWKIVVGQHEGSLV